MDKIDNVLTRGVEKIYPTKEALEKVLRSGKKIRLYQGFDPTHPSLHIGHFVGIRKLAQFQKLGHKIIFLIGDFTGMIGDPTDKMAARQRLTRNQILENLKGYKTQVENIIDFKGENPAEIQFNSRWLSPLTFEELIEISANFTVQQFLERDFFQERIKENKPIYLHEFLYPLMQGYDSVAMSVDLEVGGSDQLFNMLAGRTLLKAIKNQEKFVLTTKLFGDVIGKKMSKTEGNAIFLSDSSVDIFGKVMSMPDTIKNSGIELLSDLPLNYARDKSSLDVKKTLAFEIVKQIYGDSKAKEARKIFEKTFQKGKPEFEQSVSSAGDLTETIAQLRNVGSKSVAKRLIKDGAVDVNGKTVSDPSYKPKKGDKIKVGKKTFVEVK